MCHSITEARVSWRVAFEHKFREPFSTSSLGSRKPKHLRQSFITAMLDVLNNFTRKRVTAKSSECSSAFLSGQTPRPDNCTVYSVVKCCQPLAVKPSTLRLCSVFLCIICKLFELHNLPLNAECCICGWKSCFCWCKSNILTAQIRFYNCSTNPYLKRPFCVEMKWSEVKVNLYSVLSCSHEIISNTLLSKTEQVYSCRIGSRPPAQTCC